VPDFGALDNPIWTALTTCHASMARTAGLARRYPNDVSPLAGLRDPGPAAFADLRTLVGPEEGVGLFTAEPLQVPGDWQVLRALAIEQMICNEAARPGTAPLQTLGPTDVPEMLALAAATEPGPFLPETIRMGNYYGIRSSERRLIAMAGERLKLDAFTEISAVCTDAKFRGYGHARALVDYLVSHVFGEGKIPFLHVKSENGAKLLYEKIGFRFRRTIHLTVISPGSR
jgi:ribosomal protein S18 acetylase RimI-like enzyme